MAQFTFPGAHLIVHCACGAPMSLAHVRQDMRRQAEEYEYACSSCGSRHTIELPCPIWTPTPKDPEPEPEPPVINGSVIGYRAWRINFNTWRLQGTGANHGGPDWVPGTNEAICRISSHAAPSLHCHCGFNALARFDNSKAWWETADTNGWAPVVGAIEAWSDETVEVARPGDVAEAAGVAVTAKVIAEMYDLPPSALGPDPAPEPGGGRFVLHGTGFRAQYGKVVLLAVDDDWPAAKKAAVRALAREHEADVCKHAHLEDAAKEHGQLVPDDMLAWAKEGDPEAGAFSPGYFVPPAWSPLFPQYFTGSGLQLQTYSHTTSGFVGGSPKRAKGPRPTGKPGISQTLGYNGPPTRGKYRKNQRVRDRAGAIWRCVRGGQPGTWEREEE